MTTTKSTTNSIQSSWECFDWSDPVAVMRFCNEGRMGKEFWISSRTEDWKKDQKIAKMGEKIAELNKKLRENKIK